MYSWLLRSFSLSPFTCKYKIKLPKLTFHPVHHLLCRPVTHRVHSYTGFRYFYLFLKAQKLTLILQLITFLLLEKVSVQERASRTARGADHAHTRSPPITLKCAEAAFIFPYEWRHLVNTTRYYSSKCGACYFQPRAVSFHLLN